MKKSDYVIILNNMLNTNYRWGRLGKLDLERLTENIKICLINKEREVLKQKYEVKGQ